MRDIITKLSFHKKVKKDTKRAKTNLYTKIFKKKC